MPRTIPREPRTSSANHPRAPSLLTRLVRYAAAAIGSVQRPPFVRAMVVRALRERVQVHLRTHRPIRNALARARSLAVAPARYSRARRRAPRAERVSFVVRLA